METGDWRAKHCIDTLRRTTYHAHSSTCMHPHFYAVCRHRQHWFKDLRPHVKQRQRQPQQVQPHNERWRWNTGWWRAWMRAGIVRGVYQDPIQRGDLAPQTVKLLWVDHWLPLATNYVFRCALTLRPIDTGLWAMWIKVYSDFCERRIGLDWHLLVCIDLCSLLSLDNKLCTLRWTVVTVSVSFGTRLFNGHNWIRCNL